MNPLSHFVFLLLMYGAIIKDVSDSIVSPVLKKNPEQKIFKFLLFFMKTYPSPWLCRRLHELPYRFKDSLDLSIVLFCLTL